MNTTALYPAFLLSFFFLSVCTLHSQEFYDEGYVNQMSFDDKLRYVREIVLEGDERATTARSYQKIDKALQGFLETEFITKFKEVKLEAEILAATFKAHAMNLDPEEVAKVKLAYSQVADQFNLFLFDIKDDFMDKKKMKTIKDNPEMYSNSLQYRLSELKDSYSQNFEKAVAEVTGTDAYSAIPLVAIFGLIKLAVDLGNYIAMVNYEAKRVKEEHLQMYFIEPYRFRNWEEIEIGAGNIYNQALNDGYLDNGQNGLDTLSKDTEMNPFYDEEINSAKPVRKKNN